MQAQADGVSLVSGSGPVGTGVHLVRYAERSDRLVAADVWLTAAFLPLLPLGTWTFGSHGPDTPWTLDRVVAPAPLRAIATFAVGLLTVAAVFVPAALALTVLMGSKWLELAGVLGSAALLVVLLAWLDEKWQRVPLRAAATVLWNRRARS